MATWRNLASGASASRGAPTSPPACDTTHARSPGTRLITNLTSSDYAKALGVDPSAGLEPAPLGKQFTFILASGDVLYLPHGWPHRARTASDRSAHLSFTLSRPHPSALAAEYLTSETSAGTVLASAVQRLGL
ncbi:cupin domain-containing protein [Streptomyces sp. CoH27]|uniref:cupin domain-containing protein n=1 Tax=Streptomyces sp. CoH27 TaxID=2875763 RepID=UPI001CD7D5E8